jgi:hypothetical protein
VGLVGLFGCGRVLTVPALLGPRFWGDMEGEIEYDVVEDHISGRVFHKPRIDPHIRYKDVYLATITRKR